MTITAIDVSSHQGLDITGLIEQYQPNHVITKGYIPQELGGNGWTYTVAHAETARHIGCSTGMYVWCYADLDPAQTVRDAKVVADLAGIVLDGSIIGYDHLLQQPIRGVLHLDIETWFDPWVMEESIPDKDWIAAAEAECSVLGVVPSIYTSREMWRRCTGDGDDPSFNHLPLWAAQYSPPTASLDDYRPFGGWASCSGRQWTSTPIDQNVFREAAEEPTMLSMIELIDLAWAKLDEIQALADSSNQPAIRDLAEEVKQEVIVPWKVHIGLQ